MVKWSNGFKINRDSFDGTSKHRQLSQYNVYTDGSVLDDRTGSGLAIYRAGKEIASEHFRLPDGSTVFQAEITAIAKGAEALLKMDRRDIKYVKFFVDSQAAIQAVGNAFISSRAVANAVDRLNELAECAKRVTINWIPAHKGHAGNERADDLAKWGTNETDNTRCLTIGKPDASVKSAVRNYVYKCWGKEWDQMRIANHTKSFYSRPCRNKAKYVYKLARLELGRFVRIVTGHNNLNFFQNKLGLSNVATCRFCGDGNETVTHILSVCSRFVSQRREIFSDKIPNPDMKWSVRDLLNLSYMPGLNEAYEGTWQNGDQAWGGQDPMYDTYDLGWLEGGEEDSSTDDL